MIAALVLAVVGILGVVIWVIREPVPKPPEEPKPVIQSKEKAKSAETPTDTKELEKKTRGILGVIIALVILAVLVVYFAFFLTVGAWVARDAERRGMSGLGWATFYYIFHLGARAIVIPVVMLPAIGLTLYLGDGGVFWVVLASAEAVAWFGLAVYLVARRAGPLTPCSTCRCNRLRYLVVCPVCGVTLSTKPAP